MFGGEFYDEATGEPTLDDPRIVAALDWMASYGRRFGSEAAAFRARDQSLPGKPFPLIGPTIRHDRRRAMALPRPCAGPRESSTAGESRNAYGVCSVARSGGRPSRRRLDQWQLLCHSTRCPPADGAWEFMKFWVGLDGQEEAAAATCAAGGWIPVAQAVVNEPCLSGVSPANARCSRNSSAWRAAQIRFLVPNVPAGARFDRTVRQVAEEAMFRRGAAQPAQLLSAANRELCQELLSQQERWQRFLDGFANRLKPPMSWGLLIDFHPKCPHNSGSSA